MRERANDVIDKMLWYSKWSERENVVIEQILWKSKSCDKSNEVIECKCGDKGLGKAKSEIEIWHDMIEQMT